MFHPKDLFRGLANFVQMSIKESQTITKSSLEKTVPLKIIRGLEGWKLVDGHKSTHLSEAVYIIILETQLKEISPDEVRE